MSARKRKPPGPEPERLKIEGDWRKAVRFALRPKKGDPKPTKKKG